MRLATIYNGQDHRPALVLGDQVLDLVAARRALPAARLLPDSLRGVLECEDAGRQTLLQIIEGASRAPERLVACGALKPKADVRFAAPLPNPRMVLSVGANYHDHLREMNTPVPQTPIAFHKSLGSIVGPGEAIVLPASNPDMVDWEGEFSIVMGRHCHQVSEAEALRCVAGYTIVNDVSARDWVAPAFAAQGMMGTVVAWEHNILGKLFPTFCPMGPEIVTADEIGDPHNLAIETRLNGQTMQSSNTSDLVFNVRQIIAYYSRFLSFAPGDVITTGSPSGVGYGRIPKVFMKAGDVIEVTVEKIGTLRNPIVAANGPR